MTTRSLEKPEDLIEFVSSFSEEVVKYRPHVIRYGEGASLCRLISWDWLAAAEAHTRM